MTQSHSYTNPKKREKKGYVSTVMTSSVRISSPSSHICQKEIMIFFILEDSNNLISFEET